ncbi:hypothetical protein, partial [Vogesella mureinivorans]|uniref:hypothetical protein n=1 Tax=Vogesella mureinivorans TaxID=657276 RepID=UPI00197E2461
MLIKPTPILFVEDGAKNATEDSLTLFGWDGDLMIWESQRSNKEKENYTKHYVYEPDSFVPLLQTGYTRFIIEKTHSF